MTGGPPPLRAPVCEIRFVAGQSLGRRWILMLLDGAFDLAAIDPEFRVVGSAEMLRRAIIGCLRPQT